MLERATTRLDNLAKAERQKKDGQMSDVAHASDLMRNAFPKARHGTIQAACWAAYRSLKLSTERRARAIWNAEAKRIDAHEMHALEQAALNEYIRQRNDAMARIEALQQADRRPSIVDGGRLVDFDRHAN